MDDIKRISGMVAMALLVCALALPALVTPVAAQGNSSVYFDPRDSSAAFCETVDVAIWINTDSAISSGYVVFEYTYCCADVTDYAPNLTDWDFNSGNVDDKGKVTIGFASFDPDGVGPGLVRIGDITIHCCGHPPCSTALDWDEDVSYLLDKDGSPLEVGWDDGTFSAVQPYWTSVFHDPTRGTELRVNTNEETFQFLALDGYDSGVVHATEMTVSGDFLSGKGYAVGPFALFQFMALVSDDACIGVAVVFQPPGPPWLKTYWMHDPRGIEPSSPAIGDYSNSGCLPGPPIDVQGNQYPWCGEDKIETSVEDHTIDIVHKNATYNCCPDDIQVSLSVEGNVLRVTENEVLTTPCDCLCCYDVESTIVDLSPGTYELEYCWYDYESGRTECDTQAIVVP